MNAAPGLSMIHEGKERPVGKKTRDLFALAGRIRDDQNHRHAPALIRFPEAYDVR